MPSTQVPDMLIAILDRPSLSTSFVIVNDTSTAVQFLSSPDITPERRVPHAL